MNLRIETIKDGIGNDWHCVRKDDLTVYSTRMIQAAEERLAQELAEEMMPKGKPVSTQGKILAACEQKLKAEFPGLPIRNDRPSDGIVTPQEGRRNAIAKTKAEAEVSLAFLLSTVDQLLAENEALKQENQLLKKESNENDSYNTFKN